MLLRDIRNLEDVRLIFIIFVAACVVDTAGLFVWRLYPKDAPISKWYDKFNLVAFILDVCSIVLGILITQSLYPMVTRAWNPALFCAMAVVVQQVHDTLFSQFLVPAIQNNDIFDVLKEYTTKRGSWLILVVDGIYMVLTALLAMYLAGQKTWVSASLLITTLYIMGYALYIHA